MLAVMVMTWVCHVAIMAFVSTAVVVFSLKCNITVLISASLF